MSIYHLISLCRSDCILWNQVALVKSVTDTVHWLSNEWRASGIKWVVDRLRGPAGDSSRMNSDSSGTSHWNRCRARLRSVV